MRKGCCRMAAAFSLRKEYQMTGKNERKLKKWAALFLAAAMSLTACGSIASTGSSTSSASGTSAVSESSTSTASAADVSESQTESTSVSESTAESESISEATAASSTSGSDTASADGFATTDDVSDAPDITGITIESKMVLNYAECFNVYYCTDGYKLIDVKDGAQYLLVPDGKEAPDDLDSDVIVIHQPLERIYMAATSPMALFDAIDSLDTIRLSGETADNWYVQDAVDAMNAGTMIFAGKYSEPDYELLVSENCDLAIESTMILHSPKVQEMIEMLDIPVFIDRSSYESQPLGRTEWIKLYGAMLDKEEEAADFFASQASVVENLKDFQNTEKTVAFFYINTDGSVVVRKPSDYVPKMIEIAGGRYVPTQVDSEEETKRSSVPMTMEEFYTQAIDADYLVYNGTIDDPINSVDDLLQKSELFADFKAVKEGNVWCAGKYLYQATDIVGNMITDIHLMLTGGDASQMTFMTKID